MDRGLRLTTVRWWPALLLAMLAHAAPIAYVLMPAARPPVSLPDGPPLTLLLAPPSSAETLPSDAAIAPQPDQDAIQQAVVPDPPPETAKGPMGSLAIAKATPEAPPAPRTVAASSAAAAPPPIAAPPAAQVAAPVEGSSSQPQMSAASWEAQVAAQLEKFKRFPLAARVANQQDTVIVSFAIDAEGRTSRARIRRSAGYEVLESEALSLIARVSPLPPPPDHIPRQLSVPIEFYLER